MFSSSSSRRRPQHTHTHAPLSFRSMSSKLCRERGDVVVKPEISLLSSSSFMGGSLHCQETLIAKQQCRFPIRIKVFHFQPFRASLSLLLTSCDFLEYFVDSTNMVNVCGGRELAPRRHPHLLFRSTRSVLSLSLSLALILLLCFHDDDDDC